MKLFRLQKILFEDFLEIVQHFREICNEKFSLPEQVFIDSSLGKYDDENMDIRCFALCLAELGGIVKKSGDLNTDKMLKITESIDVTEEQSKNFAAGIHGCRNVCKFSIASGYTK